VFDGRKVETRFFWRASAGQWVFASYAWNDAQTEATLAPADGIANVAEVAPGKFHSIPSVTDCRACHDSATRTEVLGFDALQLSTDRDPDALHAEPLAPGMVTLRELVTEGRLSPSRPELLSDPPRIPADAARTRTALGYLSTNCGSCHNRESSIASLGLWLKWQDQSALDTTVDRRGHWVVPTAPPGESRLIVAGRPDLSALVARVRSRRAASQMPPLGTVVVDHAAVTLLTDWVTAMTPRTSHRDTETQRNSNTSKGLPPLSRTGV
jgi:mono/diheme cytochrome c family protein